MQRFLFNLKIAFEAIKHNTLRSVLTALGIIFGVASVISMMAIGTGAKQEILNQIKLVGVNNIVISQKEKPGKEELQSEENSDNKKGVKDMSLGLSAEDAEMIKSSVPEVLNVSPMVSFNLTGISKGLSSKIRLTGINQSYFTMMNSNLSSGKMFDYWQVASGAAVCIINNEAEKKFFKQGKPLGQKLKCGNLWFSVVGVLEKIGVDSNSKIKDLKISGTSTLPEIFTPISTVLLRFKNNALITESRLKAGKAGGFDMGDVIVSGNDNTKPKAYNQLDKIIVQVSDSKFLSPATDIIFRMLKRRHGGVEDFEITVPELLLKQQQATKDTFNIVLIVIAGISLLVGGIGIMNIMLVSVMERLREIGIRLALGATKKDVVLQFLSEAILISLSGGIVGVILGISLSVAIHKFNGILTIITIESILISFGVAAAIGLIFGIAPARKAAQLDPIESLRHE